MSAAPLKRGATTGMFEGRAHRRAALAASVAVTILLGSLAVTSGASAKASPYDVTTHYAIAQAKKPVYRKPSTHAGVLRKLAFYTPDGEALQTYRFIASRRVHGTLWEEIDVPMRPNGQTGWVKRSWLGGANVTHTLVIVDIPTETMKVYNHGKLILTVPVGTGAPGTPTPTGHYWIAEEFPSNDPAYGPWAFGTTDRATDTDFPDDSIVGIHGTDAPQLIPGDPSHGCIRLTDTDILELKPLVGIGTPVWIQ